MLILNWTRMLPAIAFVAWAGGVILPAHANDTTIPCNSPPEKGASVAVHPGNQVSTTQDDQEKTCVFSINGAVATSPPAADVLNALNTFRDASKPYLRDPNVAVSAIAALLASAAPVDHVPPELVELLAKFTQSLRQCLGDFSSISFRPATYSEGPFTCRGIAPYTNPQEKSGMLRETGLAVSVPTIAISLVWERGRFKSAVYLPLSMVGAPRL